MLERLTITGMGSELEGVGRKSDGKAVFVPGALLGEEVSAEIIEEKRTFARARLMNVINASPERAEPFCPHYGTCGGCDAQHITYAASLRFKAQHVHDCLARISGISEPDVRPTVGMTEPLAYRNKAELPLSAGRIGFYARGSREVIDLPDGCPLLRPELNRALLAVREWLRRCKVRVSDGRSGAVGVRHMILRASRRGEVMAIAVVAGGELPHARELWTALSAQGATSLMVNYNDRPGAAVTGPRYARLYGKDTYEDTILGARFELSAPSFFQVNPEMTDALYTHAIEAARLSSGSSLLDAYCGAGTVGIAMLKAAHAEDKCALTGIEIVPEAVDNAIRNARLNGIVSAEYHCGGCETVLDRLTLAGYRPDVAAIDPPRRGCDDALLWALARSGPERIAYISCNPSTLARDVKLLMDAGYAFGYAQPVDMFPWTSHVETVVLMSKLRTDKHITVEVKIDELDVTSEESKATYA